MDLTRHPIHFLNFLRLRSDSEKLSVQFVTFTYKNIEQPWPMFWPMADVDDFLLKESLPYSKKGDSQDRDYFWVPLAKITEKWLEEMLGALPSDLTFGFTGRVNVEHDNGTVTGFFVPTLDFVVRNAPSGLLVELLRHFEFDEDGPAEAALYTTDYSFHAYFSKLVPVTEFAKYMGEALLFNENDGNVIDERIDTRWVGNSLLRGAATLRWSVKHTHPKGLPALTPGFPTPAFLKPKSVKGTFRDIVEGR